MLDMLRAAPDRVAVYGVENHAGTPVYVHAKTCLVDDQWATVGSDNFNRRSWTHDSELSAAVIDTASGTGSSGFAQRLRLALAAEHLDRPFDPEVDASDDGSLLSVMGDCVDPAGQFAAYAESAAALDAWHAGGEAGERPAGRLRRLDPPEMVPLTRALALPAYLVVHDPDGRPRPLRRQGGF